jgi:hypothetical protein
MHECQAPDALILERYQKSIGIDTSQAKPKLSKVRVLARLLEVKLPGVFAGSAGRHKENGRHSGGVQGVAAPL